MPVATPAPRPAAVVTTTQSFLQASKEEPGSGTMQSCPSPAHLSSQSCKHRLESGVDSFSVAKSWAAGFEAQGMWAVF